MPLCVPLSLLWLALLSLERAVDFFTRVLNGRVLRHEENTSNCAATCNGPPSSSGQWSKTMVGLSDERHFAFELTYNYGVSSYKPGNSLRYLTINVPGAASRAKTGGWKVDTSEDSSALAVVCGPDAMRFRCIEDAVSPSHAEKERDPVVSVSLNVSDLDRSLAFYTKVLGMTTIKGTERSSEGRRAGDWLQLGYHPAQTRLELTHTGAPIEHGDSVGRLAYSTTSVDAVHERVKAASPDFVLHAPQTLSTPGKADVQVVILRDPDGFELCFVEVDGFDQLSAPRKGAERIDWAEREKKVREVEGGGKREEKESGQEEEPVVEEGRRLVDESEFDEGGDERQGKGAEAKRLERVETDESSYTATTWESSPHEKIGSPAESKLNH